MRELLVCTSEKDGTDIWGRDDPWEELDMWACGPVRGSSDAEGVA